MRKLPKILEKIFNNFGEIIISKYLKNFLKVSANYLPLFLGKVPTYKCYTFQRFSKTCLLLTFRNTFKVSFKYCFGIFPISFKIILNFGAISPQFPYRSFKCFQRWITTILTPITSEGGSGGDGYGHVFCFWGPRLQISNVNILLYILRSYDTGRSFDPIIMKFTRLVQVHYSWVNRIVYENKLPNRTTDIGENMPPNQFFGFKLDCFFFFFFF